MVFKSKMDSSMYLLTGLFPCVVSVLAYFCFDQRIGFTIFSLCVAVMVTTFICYCAKKTVYILEEEYLNIKGILGVTRIAYNRIVNIQKSIGGYSAYTGSVQQLKIIGKEGTLVKISPEEIDRFIDLLWVRCEGR